MRRRSVRQHLIVDAPSLAAEVLRRQVLALTCATAFAETEVKTCPPVAISAEPASGARGAGAQVDGAARARKSLTEAIKTLILASNTPGG